MKVNLEAQLDPTEELLTFVQELIGGYSEGMSSPHFDHRSYLAQVVIQAHLLYTYFELKPRIGSC